MSFLKFDDVLPHLSGVRANGNGMMALCPAHDDHDPSLAIDRAGNGLALLHCHAGCKYADIIAALSPESVTPPIDKDPSQKRETTNDAPIASETVYEYTDLSGNTLYQVIRKQPKKFRQRRPDGKGGWLWNLKGIRRVIFRWPAVAKAVVEGQPIFVVEGEKDVLGLEGIGVVATCNSGGAGKWTEDLSEALRNADVIVLPDNDEAGRKHGELVVSFVEGIARSIRVLNLPHLAEKGDVSDWIAAGGTREQLMSMVDDIGQVFATGQNRSQIISFGEIASEPVDWLWRNRIACGKITVLDGDPGGGKSLVTIDIAARLSTGLPFPGETERRPPCSVVMLNAEDGEADTIRPRLEAAGADVSLVYTIKPNAGSAAGPVSIPKDIERLREAVAESKARLLVIDPIMAFLSTGICAHKDQDVRLALHPLKRLAESAGIAVILVRHLNKVAGPNPLYRGGGSIGIIAAARIGMVIANDPDNANRRVLAVSKINVGRFPASLSFAVNVAASGAPVIEWQGESPHTAQDLLAPVNHEFQSQLSAAKEFLLEVLPASALDIQAQAKENGIAKATLRREDLPRRACGKAWPTRIRRTEVALAIAQSAASNQ